MLKKIFIFLLSFLPWTFSSFIPVHYGYFKELQLPFFTPPTIFYPIAWTLVYLFIAFSITIIIDTYGFKKIPLSYKITLLINYLFNQSFTLVFFGLHNTFLGFISCLGTFVSCLFLYQETYELKEKSTKLLDPYVLLSLFATILSLTIYLMNTL